MQRLTIRREQPQRVQSPWQSLCDCTHCGLYPSSEQAFLPVHGVGNNQARIICVGEAPGETEVALNTPFIGQSGRLLDYTLAKVGIERSDVYCTNAVLCRPQDNREPTAREVAACNQRLRQEILSLPQRHVILLLGTTAVKAVTGRNEGVTASLFKVEWSTDFNCFLVFSYHPAACLRSADYYTDVLSSFYRAADLLNQAKGTLPTPTVDYRVAESIRDCVFYLQGMYFHTQDIIACDTETTGLDWRTDTLTQVGFAWNIKGTDYAYIIPSHILSDSFVREALRELFTKQNISWAWHNGKFDLQFLRKYGVPEARVDIDTMLLHKSLDERSGVHGLKQLTARYFSDYSYGEEKVGFTDPVYHAKDCVYTLKLARDVLPREFAREDQSRQGYPGPRYRHDTILAPVWNAIMDIELYGVLVDRVAALELAVEMGNYPDNDLGGTLKVRQQKCQALSGFSVPKVVTKQRVVAYPTEYYKKDNQKKGIRKGDVKLARTHIVREKVTEHVGMNINSSSQMGELLYKHWGLPVLKTTPKGQPSVDEETLAQLLTVCDSQQQAFLQELLGYRKEYKHYSTYVVGALEESRITGRVHTHFSFNPVTGRPSSADLNIQNIPRKSPIKKLYIASPGYHFVEADYAQQEMRVAAWYSRDVELLKACTQGDFHAEVSKMVFRSLYEEIEDCMGSLVALEQVLGKHTSYSHLQAMHMREHYDAAKLIALLEDYLRFAAKAINFGALYGQTPQGLKDHLWLEQHIFVTLEEAIEYHRSWFSKFEQLSAWLAARRLEMLTYGFVDTPMGHRRRKYLITEHTRKEAENQAMNSPVQSLASDMTMLAIIALHKELEEKKLGHILFFVHDSIAFEIKQDRLEEGAVLIRERMTHALDPIQHDDFYVPFPVDMKYGRGWGELQKLVAQ